MQAGANVQVELAELVADGDGAADGATRTVERGEHSVTERLDEPPPVALDLLADERIVPLEQCAPAAVAQLGRARGRTDYVGEQHCRQHAVAENGSSHTRQELLDLVGRVATWLDLDVACVWDVGRRVARMAFVDVRVAR